MSYNEIQYALAKVHPAMVDSTKAQLQRAERIRTARNELTSLSQPALAKIMGVSPGAVGQWETTGKIKNDNLLKLAEVLGVNIDWLSRGRGEMAQRDISQLQSNTTEGKDRKLIPAYRVLWDGTQGTLRDTEEPYSMIVRPDGVKSPHAYALTVISVQDHSGFRAGSTIFVDPSYNPQAGEWALIRTGNSVQAVEIEARTARKLKYLHIFTREPGDIPLEDIDSIESITNIAH